MNFKKYYIILAVMCILYGVLFTYSGITGFDIPYKYFVLCYGVLTAAGLMVLIILMNYDEIYKEQIVKNYKRGFGTPIPSFFTVVLLFPASTAFVYDMLVTSFAFASAAVILELMRTFVNRTIK